jgi:hypothetical protein
MVAGDGASVRSHGHGTRTQRLVNATRRSVRFGEGQRPEQPWTKRSMDSSRPLVPIPLATLGITPRFGEAHHDTCPAR